MNTSSEKYNNVPTGAVSSGDGGSDATKKEIAKKLPVEKQKTVAYLPAPTATTITEVGRAGSVRSTEKIPPGDPYNGHNGQLITINGSAIDI